MLQIIVVDDGSTDGSRALVKAMANEDSRITYMYQQNSGPAMARNAGAALATADFIAFCDADDLWAPLKIEYQLVRLRQGGDRMGLVYCRFALIDAADNILAIKGRIFEGAIFSILLRENVIGNGSSPLFRASAFAAVGGFNRRYEPAEDLALYLATAERFEIGVVAEPLVGYRILNDSLSSDGIIVYASAKRLLGVYAQRFPEYRPIIIMHERGLLLWLLFRAVRSRRYATAVCLLKQDPRVIYECIRTYVPRFAAREFACRIQRRGSTFLGFRRKWTFDDIANAGSAYENRATDESLSTVGKDVA